MNNSKYNIKRTYKYSLGDIRKGLNYPKKAGRFEMLFYPLRIKGIIFMTIITIIAVMDCVPHLSLAMARPVFSSRRLRVQGPGRYCPEQGQDRANGVPVLPPEQTISNYFVINY